MRLVPRAALALVAVAALAVPARAQNSGSSAKGFLKIDGKTVQLRHALAVTGPDSFDDTVRKTYVFVTEKPIADVASAESVRALRQRMGSGIRIEFGGESPNAQLSIAHPALGSDSISTAGFGFKAETPAPDRVKGTLQSWGFDRNEDEEIFDHKIRYDLTFDVPVTREFAVTPKLTLSANAKKVGPGGGEPGKVYLANCAKASNVPKTAKELEKQLEKEGGLPSDADLEEMSKETGKKVTRQDAVEMLFELVKLGSELAPKNCKVLGGRYDDKVAILQVEAEMLGERSRTDAVMEKVDGVWTLKKHETWTSAK